MRTPGARDAPITTALIVVNVLVFMLEENWGGSDVTATLVRMGAIYRDEAEVLRAATLLSYGYLHIGALHIGMNMFALWNIGRLLEPVLGSARFFVLYSLSLLGGGAAIMASPAPHVTAGASGALFGLLGAICALLWRRYRNARFGDERRVILGSIGRLLLPNVVISLLPGVSLLGHAGGLVVGALFTAPFFAGKGQLPRTPERSVLMIGLALVLGLLTVFAVGSVWLYFQPWRVAVG